MTDISQPFQRVVALLPENLVLQADELAIADTRFYMFGKPSRAAVIREALALFFATGGANKQHLESNNDKT